MNVVAYQGEVGAYSEEGALALFPEAERQAFPSIRKGFEAVEVGRVAAGLVPLDNSQAGSINETYDLFLRHGLHLSARRSFASTTVCSRYPGLRWTNSMR
jgi:Prephenate dehydratase